MVTNPLLILYSPLAVTLDGLVGLPLLVVSVVLLIMDATLLVVPDHLVVVALLSDLPQSSCVVLGFPLPVSPQ